MVQTLMPPPVAKKDALGPVARSDFWGNLSPFGLPFGRMLDDFWSRPLLEGADQLLAPPLDVEEDENAFSLSMELPGLKKEDVSLQFENGVLSVSGEKRSESEKKGKNFHRMERRYGSFFRSLALPSSVNMDAVDAEFKDGVLKVRIPKREAAKPKSLKIK